MHSLIFSIVAKISLFLKYRVQDFVGVILKMILQSLQSIIEKICKKVTLKSE